ncbi:hypothetical protein FE391_40240 [Nonomuraea sp. KC401]|uniref:hypothetical protein n=1 Tax=unclassified Nonomuraea TaxID=2593643 RepID=UPI0010FDA50F|nr:MULTISPECIES: hypothetical protein [unclassified Nonomuraea]NBE98676.1 hypothetical protein [Nonomuraea sp. K271]TLF55664.1 hypothetical protein FE391_40240 [Nonomuraea sp. KC401]
MTEQSPAIGRVTAAIATVATMLPYLTLKILWLTGSSLGVTDPGLMNDPAMAGLNVMTFGMDAVGLLLVVAFTTRWGLRLPAWLVLLPMWVGTGLLSVVVVTAPIMVTAGGIAVFSGGPIEPWVYMMVYGGFVGQGMGLMATFVLYARDRWPGVSGPGHAIAGPARQFQTAVAWGSLLVVTLVAGVRLSWTFGAPVGAVVMDGFKALLALAGAVAFVAVVRERGKGSFWRLAVPVWLGSGSLFGWGLYAMIVRSVGGPLAVGGAAATDLVELFGMLAGLVMGMSGAYVLAERSGVRSRMGDVQPLEQPLEGDDRDGDRQAAYHGHR